MKWKHNEKINYLELTDICDISIVSDMVLDQHITCNSVRKIVSYITHDIHKMACIIEKMKEQGKDTSVYEYDIDRALYALGLAEKPSVHDYKFFKDQQKRKGA